MKKILFIVALCLTISTQAQNINDAMLYSQTNLNGTARFRAMSGAFGALGADFSSLNVNPAGSVVFANNQAGFSLTNYNTKNNSNYFEKTSSDKNNNFDLNQAGVVFVFENGSKKSDWKKFAFALNYENANNFDNSLYSAGNNPSNSIDDYFLHYANGIELQNIDDSNYYYDELYYNEQQAYLGYQSYIIDPSNSNTTNTSYFTNISNAGNYYQTNSTVTSGYNGKLSFNGSANYKNKFMFGINLNSHFTDYRKSSVFKESNVNAKYAVGSTVDRVNFYNDLYTYGNGFSFQVGTIFKPTKDVRFGLAYESPTWYKLNDELTQSVSTSGYGLNASQDNTVYGNVTTNPNVTMVYAPYKLQSPGKWTGSFAYIFGKKGLISLDYTMKDYSNTKFRPTKDYTEENKQMSELLVATNEFRLGAEYKIKKVSLRGGYRFEQSPYKNGTTVGDLTGYSAGIGYNFGNTKLDLAYSTSKRDYYNQFFSQGMIDAAKINAKNNNMTLTLLFEL